MAFYELKKLIEIYQAQEQQIMLNDLYDIRSQSEFQNLLTIYNHV